MEQVTLQAAVPAKPSDPQQFVDSASLKSYAQATTVLTVVVNLILYVYNAIRDGRIMPNKLLIPIAVILSVLYVLSFFKKDPSNTLAQYCWITSLNSIMLFTSISGVNSMLYSARQSFETNNQTTVKASLGNFFVDLLFPKHSWFGGEKIVLTPGKEEIVSITNSLDTTKQFIDTLLAQKQNDLATINQLHEKVDSLQTNYIQTLNEFSRVQESVVKFQDSMSQVHVNYQPQIEVAHLAPKIETEKNILVRDQKAQQVEQVQQQQEQQQNVQVLKTKQWQIQQQQQQIKTIQSRQVLRAGTKLN